MKRYLVFAGAKYYPCEGWEDFKSSHDDLVEAMKATIDLAVNHDWTQIVDLETLKVVRSWKTDIYS
jgi:hypothetical protein